MLPAPTPSYICWELKASPGPHVGGMLATASVAGVQIEPISSAESRYRFTGDDNIIKGLASTIEKNADGYFDGWSLAAELPPPGGVTHYSARVAPASPYRRTIYLHGVGEAFRHLKLAIDSHLQISSVGMFRWAVTGRTAALMAWMAEAFGESVDVMLKRWNLTPADVAAEDAPTGFTAAVSVPVTVRLPELRSTTTAIRRNAAGEIVEVNQTTKDAGYGEQR